MTHRRIEFVVPSDAADKIDGVLEKVEVLDRSSITRDDEKRTQINIIVEDSATEHLIDRFRDAYGDEHIGAYIFEIDGVYPKPKNSDKQESVLPWRNEAWQFERVSREELLSDLAAGSIISKMYISQVVIATVVAAAGMMRGSVALVIAGMMIAPLLMPNMSLALGTALGDLKMVRQAVVTGVAGLTLSVVIALGLGLTIPFDVGIEEIAARSYVSMADIIIALAAGAAGAIAVTTAVSPGLVGVMVAVALVPPLVAVGLFTGGGHFEAAWGAAVLTATNLVCINLAAVVVFVGSGIRPHTWYEEKNAKRASITAVCLWIVLLLALAGLIWKAAPNVPIKPQKQEQPMVDNNMQADNQSAAEDKKRTSAAGNSKDANDAPDSNDPQTAEPADESN